MKLKLLKYPDLIGLGCEPFAIMHFGMEFEILETDGKVVYWDNDYPNPIPIKEFVANTNRFAIEQIRDENSDIDALIEVEQYCKEHNIFCVDLGGVGNG